MRTLPPLNQTALLLDLDGTLLDLAPTPDTVCVPSDLPATLTQLRTHLGGALAIVTGRPIEQVDDLLPDIAHAVAAEHGGVIRHEPAGQAIRLPLPTPSAELFAAARVVIDGYPGTLLELKRRGFVFHFRAVPHHSRALHEAAMALMSQSPDFQVLEASMAWEIRPRGVDKGSAVAALMQRTPFYGRVPVFIGDDVTDKDGIRMCESLGGAGFLVADCFQGPAGVRAWLARAAVDLMWPPL